MDRLLKVKPDFTTAWSVKMYPYHESMRDRVIEAMDLVGVPRGDLDAVIASTK